MLLDYLWDWISTHAPHAGSDTTSIRPMAACPNFNSRSPCRERPLVAGKEMLLLLFQSTLPMRGATMGTVPAVPGRLISTHAPHAGSDSNHRELVSGGAYFNPRSPCGERHTLYGTINTVRKFQPTLPMRGATVIRGVEKFAIKFQPTLPMRGATLEVFSYADTPNISTHAPHAGSDLTPAFQRRHQCRFQPTLPMRGATVDCTVFQHADCISTHAPHAGSDHFPLHQHLYTHISTHAPHAGSDPLHTSISADS